MGKNILSWMVIATMSYGDSPGQEEAAGQQQEQTIPYAKDDLKKIKWIEGKWRGLYNGQPFYEIYQMLNDSTLEITYFEWNGKDSSKTNRSYVYFKNGIYYLGDKQNYKVSSITEKEIKMVPHIDANNDIVWRYRDSTGWDAILTSANKKIVYKMEHFDPFKKGLSEKL